MKNSIWFVSALLFALAATRSGAALSVSTNFEGASARVLAIDNATQTVRVSPAGDPARGWPCWWYLRVDGIDATKPLTLEVAASRATLPASGRKPARALAPAWALPGQAAVSTNGIVWARTANCERRGGTAIYRMPAGATTLWLAWGPPFTPSDATEFVQRVAERHSFATAVTLARSREGRAVPALQIAEGTKPAAQRRGICILARQHAWEAGGSWVGIGFAEWLASEDEHARWLRQNTEVFFVPIMDVDHVASGDGGKECLPQDANFDWTDTPHWPEVAAIQKRILTWVKEQRMDLLVDLHNPGAGQREVDLWITPTNVLTGLQAQNQGRFFAAMRREVREPMTVNAQPHWDGPGNDPDGLTRWHKLSCPWTYDHGNPHTVAITMETPWNIPAGTSDGYRAVGRRLGLAIESYLREQKR
jgi:hypothetical protein